MKKASTIILPGIFAFFFLTPSLQAQGQLGIGVHFAPPVQIDNCCNTYVKVRPALVPAYSLSYRGLLGNQRRWYLEAGLTTMGLGINVQNFFNDTVVIWGEFTETHVGFPSVFLEGGTVIPLAAKKLKQDLAFGIEGSYRLAHSLDGIHSANFGLSYSGRDVTSPFFVRLMAGYGIQDTLFSRIPFHLQAYGKFSFQQIARGAQFVRDPSTGQINDEGKYGLNNSEIGLKIYINTNLSLNGPIPVKKEKTPKVKIPRPLAYRLSVEGQLYMPPATTYFIPQALDSFSLKGLPFTYTQQAGVKMEIFNPENDRWVFVSGVHFGITMTSLHFKASPSFTRTGESMDFAQGSVISNYIMPNAGLGYVHPAGKKHIQHSLSATLVIPLEKESHGTLIFDGADPSLPPDLWPSILKTYVDYDYGRSSALLGLEYQPELLFSLDKRFFCGIGLVFNISSGVIAQGRATVDNGRTRYNGAVIQHFSKIGLTLRMGLNAARPSPHTTQKTLSTASAARPGWLP